mgnify:CR=1 FL=1
MEKNQPYFDPYNFNATNFNIQGDPASSYSETVIMKVNIIITDI